MPRALGHGLMGHRTLGLRPMTSAAQTDGAAVVKPRDIFHQYESQIEPLVFHTGQNIPAGGSNLGYARYAAGQGTQNSSFKNFDRQRARA